MLLNSLTLTIFLQEVSVVFLKKKTFFVFNFLVIFMFFKCIKETLRPQEQSSKIKEDEI